jgi:hypothetical protein
VPTPGLVEGARLHGATKIEVISGVVLDRSQGEDGRHRFRASLGIPETTCVFVYLGALGVANGLDILLDSAKRLGPDEPLLILLAGDGSDRERLEHRIEQEAIPYIRLLGLVPRKDVGDVLAASDVCLHVLKPDPLFEGALPNKILEYFGAHRPFITTVPGIPERLALDSGGGFAPSRDALVAEARRWTAMPAVERRSRGEQGFAYGSKHFGLGPTVDRLEATLARAIESHAARPSRSALSSRSSE